MGTRRAAGELLPSSHPAMNISANIKQQKNTKEKKMFVTLPAALFPIYSEFLDYSLPTFPLGEFLMVEACV